MHHCELVENFETGLWKAKNGDEYIRCEFDPTNPVWIHITEQVWETSYAGKPCKLRWQRIALPSEVKADFKLIIQERLKRKAPTYLGRIEETLKKIANGISICKIDLSNKFSNVGSLEMLSLWNCLTADNRSIFRSLIKELAQKGLCGIQYDLAIVVASWSLGREKNTLRDVVNWDSKTGSLTSAELELIREVLYKSYLDETDLALGVRVFCLVLLETLKRPIQVLSMTKDALWIPTPGKEFFLRIPPGKLQKAGKSRPWQITSELAKYISEYSARVEVQKLQSQFNRLIVFPHPTKSTHKWKEHGQVDSMTANLRLKEWIDTHQLISPRTSESIHLTAYRLRHTGATAMALQGVPRDEIQEVLEHDSPHSADAYINATGSDLMPALERATDRGLGELFSVLGDAFFFKGEVIDSVRSKKIYIPIVSQKIDSPALIGGCRSDEVCVKHPLWACYTCPNFLAWKEGNHQKSIEFIEEELGRWDKAEGGKERSKLGKDFERIGAAIKEVIVQISHMDK